MSFFSRKITGSEDKFFAIDLSDHSVKIFEIAKTGRKNKVRSFGCFNIPEGYIEDGKIMDKPKIVEIIKSAVKKTRPRKINTRNVVCSLPESKAFLRIISIPKIDEDEAEEAVRWELEASIPLTTDQVYYDWQFLNEAGGRQNVLTVAVSRDIVDDTMEVMEKAGLSVLALEVESIASSRSLIPNKVPMEEISIIVDVGGHKTSFIICEGTVPYFTSSIPFSSDAISDAISGKLNMSREEADEVKIAQGIESTPENSTIFNVVSPLLENLAVEIEKTLDFYRSISKSTISGERIILCGGGANLKGLVPYLANRLGKDVFVGDPWINFNSSGKLPIINNDDSIRYATSIGLALKNINYGN